MSVGVEKTTHLAAEFAKKLNNSLGLTPENLTSKGATVVGLYGDLGSGKTCFMQGVGQTLGVSERMVSPTFVIEKIYKLNSSPAGDRFSHLIHIDAYRIEKSEEMLHLGWQELLKDPKNLVCIEWPEKIADIMPPNHIKISFTFMDENTRAIDFENFEI